MAGYLWFRMYHEMIEDPKIGTLSDQEFRLWVELLCLACAFGKDGDTGLTVEELCWKLRRNVSETLQSRLCNGCISIEETINGRKTVIIKNWKKRQFLSDSSTTRVRKCRELKKNIHENVSETLQKRKRNGTDTDTDTDKIKRKNKSKETPSFIYPEKYSDLLKSKFNDFIRNRTELKKPVTEIAFNSLVNKLEKLSGGDEKTSIEILENSIENGWAGIFEIKGKKPKQQLIFNLE